MTLDFLNVWKKAPETLKGVRNGDPLAYLRVADEARTAQFTAQYTKGTVNAFKAFGSNVTRNGFESASRATMQNASSTFLSSFAQANNVEMFRYISHEGFHNAIPSSLRVLNCSMVETGVGRGIVKALGGKVAYSAGSTAFKSTATITGSTAGKVAGKALCRVPVLGIVISSLFEIPDLVDAYKNGDFGAQVGRSVLNVACSTAGMAIGAALGSCLGPVGTVIGGFLGGMIGSAIGKGLGRLLFGKSIKDKMRDGDYARNLMRTYNTMNFNNVGRTGGLYGSNTAAGTEINVDKMIASINTGLNRVYGY